MSLKKYCSEILVVNFKDKKKIKEFTKQKKVSGAEILLGSGFAELLEEDLFYFQGFDRGNNLKVHQEINSENFFFNLQENKINVPPWSLTKPNSKDWLLKDFLSFGGNSVSNFLKNPILGNFQYFQKIIQGENLSIQFFSKNKKIKILSVCNQFFSKRNHKPFLIESIISRKTSPKLLKRLLRICYKICYLYNLNGINNLDMVLETSSEKIFVIELNARPGLSTNLIYKIHKDIFTDSFFQAKKRIHNFYYGTQIIYSDKKVIIDKKKLNFFKNLANNNSFSELPLGKQIINIDEPICLVHLKSKKNQILRDNLKKISYKVLNNLSK